MGEGGGHFFNFSLPFSPAPSGFFQINEKWNSQRILKKFIIMDGKGKITLFSKNIKKISEKFKNIQFCRSAIPEIRNIWKSNLPESNYSN